MIGDGAGRATRRGIFGVGRVGDVGGVRAWLGRIPGLGFDEGPRVFELVVDEDDGGGMLFLESGFGTFGFELWWFL